MLIVKIVIIIAVILGISFVNGNTISVLLRKRDGGIVTNAIMGLLYEMSVMQIIAVFIILLQRYVDRFYLDAFAYLTYIYSGVMLASVIVGIIVLIVRISRKKAHFEVVIEKNRNQYILWGIFFILFAIILAMSCIMRFEDGDDAYFVTVSGITEQTNSIYWYLPYTGGGMQMDMRHALAPFPVVIAYISRVSGIHVSTVAHVCMPLIVIPFSLMIYYAIASMITESKNVPLILIFTEIMLMFSNYSKFSAENFLLVRSWQGKAVLANIIIPALFLMLITVIRRIEDKMSVKYMTFYFLLLGFSAGLCSIQGLAIIAALLVIAYAVVAIGYKDVLKPLCFMTAFIPAAIYLLLYVKYR